MGRMIAIFVFACVMFVNGSSNAENIPEASRGSTLYHDCLALLRTVDGTDSRDLDVAFNGLHCRAYIDGFMDAIINAHATGTPQTFCFQKQMSNGVVLRLYVNYMRAHPKLLDDFAGAGFWAALRDAYPCQKK